MSLRKKTNTKRQPLVRDTKDYHVTQPVDDPLARQQQALQQGLLINGVRYQIEAKRKDPA